MTTCAPHHNEAAFIPTPCLLSPTLVSSGGTPVLRARRISSRAIPAALSSTTSLFSPGGNVIETSSS